MWLPAVSTDVLIAFTCLYGFCSGIFISVTPSAVAQITLEAKIGARLSAFSTCTAVATLIGTPIGGALIREETRAGYQPLIIFSGCTLIAGGAMIFTSRLLHGKDLMKRW
ncbi:hypothetical protein T310_0408 [Rasamsonia emersonii CBS 393.64]|uniref:Major facilitator superfamily (MFS) profile domain-containing protein n=1 Tax=Rasamsonia emersonii (strain ATCC 16479 / CBS 393.64 / IMI 116815) TaxID=1408163 RepID=A0A0F4Z6L7_RASE3|nr:hypothetical protein T310_0408 [Rasamsonia emersonii CBS 393.64]KKA25528.1 hypothetical protein T310_0408 [Rasamsonia emersonii CBS 393.64]